MNLVEILSIVAISLFCLLGVFLLSKEQALKIGLGWLGAFYILLAINFLDGILLINGFLLQVPYLALWEDPLALLYGPLIYFFAIHLKNNGLKRQSIKLLHFLPFIIVETGVLIFHLRYSNNVKQQMLEMVVNGDQDPAVIFGIILLFLMHVFSYTVVAYRILLKHQSDLKNYYSNPEIKWAFTIIRMIIILFSVSLLTTSVQFMGTKSIYSVALLMVILVSIFLTVRILLFALNQPLFQKIKTSSNINLLPEEKEKLKKRIHAFLSENKLFKNPKLSLQDLANQIGAPQREVSHVINDSMADNFYDLINNYRIEEAKKIFESNQDNKLTVLEVLYEVGFNSKSSFNTQFKKKTGLTPSEFKKVLNKN